MNLLRLNKTIVFAKIGVLNMANYNNNMFFHMVIPSWEKVLREPHPRRNGQSLVNQQASRQISNMYTWRNLLALNREINPYGRWRGNLRIGS